MPTPCGRAILCDRNEDFVGERELRIKIGQFLEEMWKAKKAGRRFGETRGTTRRQQQVPVRTSCEICHLITDARV